MSVGIQYYVGGTGKQPYVLPASSELCPSFHIQILSYSTSAECCPGLYPHSFLEGTHWPPPPISLWLSKIPHVKHNKCLRASLHHREEKFQYMWYSWSIFPHSTTYQELICSPNPSFLGLLFSPCSYSFLYAFYLNILFSCQKAMGLVLWQAASSGVLDCNVQAHFHTTWSISVIVGLDVVTLGRQSRNLHLFAYTCWPFFDPSAVAEWPYFFILTMYFGLLSLSLDK